MKIPTGVTNLARKGWLKDVGILGLLLVLGGWLAMVQSPPVPGLPEPPAWGSQHDLVLQGPDAGEWANAAQVIHRGDLQDLDPHRMPTWPVLVSMTLTVVPDVAQASHLVNHILFLLLPLVIYGIGAAGGGRAVGLGAATLVVTCEPLVRYSRMAGVDPAVAFFLPAAVLAALSVRRWPWLAPLSGALALLASFTHYTALPYVVITAMVVLFRGPPGWSRPLALLGHLLGVAAAAWVMHRLFPLPSIPELIHAISEGVAPQQPQAQVELVSEEALQILQEGRATAADRAVAGTLAPLWPDRLPWTVGLVLPWIGVLGLGLQRGRERGLKGLLRSTDLALGLPLLLALAPLPVLAAASAPNRYSWNLLPFTALLLARGLVSAAVIIEEGLGRLVASLRPLPSLPMGTFAALAVATLAMVRLGGDLPSRHMLPVMDHYVAARGLGDLLSRHFPPGGGAACAIREANAHAGLSYCPLAACPFGTSERAFLECLGLMDQQCPGDGPIPYVVLHEAEARGVRRERMEMDRWVAASWSPLERFRGRTINADIYAIPRGMGLAPPQRGPPVPPPGGP